MPQKIKKLRVDVSADKTSIKSRTALASVMGTQIANNNFVQSRPALKGACEAVVAAGAELEAADSAFKNAEVALATARSARDAKVATFDDAHAVCVAITEQVATSPEDIQSIGFAMADRANHVLAPPVAVEVRFDVAKDVIRVYVKHAPGMTACTIEISSDPFGPGTWRKIEGTGARRLIGGNAPGTYWIRAASVRANAQSAFTSPVSVIVK